MRGSTVAALRDEKYQYHHVRCVSTEDLVPPTISILGNNPVIVNKDTSYVDQGAVATDDIDGTVNVITIGGVDTTKTGSYTITYTAIDKANNIATATRTVEVKNPVVLDSIPPTITILGNNPEIVMQGTTYVDQGAVATDDTDGTVNVIASGEVDTTKVGSYTITYTAIDKASNKATVTRTVEVKKPVILDTTPPTIHILGNNPGVAMQGTPYTDIGATATDNIDGAVEVVSSGLVDTSLIGTYTINYTATDKAGNESTAQRSVIVKQPPVLESLVYAELTGRVGHQGIRPLQKKPVAGTVYLIITTTGDATALVATVTSDSGDEQSYTTEVSEIAAESSLEDSGDDLKEWIIEVEIPAGESSVLVTMAASNNQQYPAPIQTIVASSIGLELSRSDVDFSPGPNTVSALISNYDEEATFSVSATDNYQLVEEQFSAQTLSIKKGQSQTVDIPVNLLAENMQGDIYDYQIAVRVENTALIETNTAKMDINLVKVPMIVNDQYKLVIINPGSCGSISKGSQTVEVIIAGSEKLFLDKVDFDSIIWMNGELKPLSPSFDFCDLLSL